MPFVPEENPGVTRPTQQTTAYSVAGKQYNIPSHWLNNPNFKRAFERAGNEGRLWTPPSTNQYAPERELQVIPQNRSYWESPQRVARYYDLIRSAPPTWTPPDWMNTDAIKEAYEYMRYRNDFKPVNEWAWLPEDDPASYFLKDLQAPPNSALWTNEKAYAMMGVPTQAEIDQNKPLDWASMPLYQQILVGILSPETGIEERPEWTRIPAAFVQAAMAAPAGTAIGAAVAGLPGAAIGTALVGGLTFAQAYFGKEIPGVTQFLEIMDAGAIFAERVVGLGKIGSEVGFAELMKMLPEAYKASSATYETQELDLVNKIVPGLSKTLDWMHEHAMLPEGSGWEGELAKANEVWQIQKGFTTPQPLEGERGVAALLEATAMLQRGDPFEQVYAEMVDRFGYSGTLNDFIEQSMIDPAFLAPGVGGRAGEFIARATGNERLAQAFNMTKGSLLIDALPPGLQQIVQAASGVKGSEGILTGVRLWKDWVQTGYYPATMFDMPKDMRQTFEKAVAAGVDPKDIQVNENKMTWTDKNGKQQTYTGSRKILVEIPDVDRLTSMERFIGGIDLTYGIKELKPSFERKGIAKLVSLDPASQAHVLLNLYHTVTATLFDRANGDPFQMGDMLRQLMGEDAVKAGDPGEMILKSPAARAVRDATKAGAKIAKYEEQLAQWQAVAGGTAADGTRIVGKRDILLAIADALGEKPADILTQLQNNPDVLMARLAETTGIPGSPEYIKETLSAFIGDNPLPWNEQQFQVRLINTIADAMSEYMQKVYGLKPDPALIRVGQVLKGVQSLVLLGFNPGYFFNNEVNNIVTRAAVGVFGYMTPKQISDYYTRLGIEPSRLRVGASPGDEGATYGGQQLIVDLKDSADAIGKANKAVRAVTRKLGIFSRMSAHMESIEGANSFTIGTKQFMQKAWRRGKGFRKMHPAVEAVLDQNFPGMKAIIYSAIEAGINMTEINSAIYGEYIKPSLRTAAEEAAKKVFPNNPDIGMDILERTGLLDKIEDRLQTAETPEKIDAVFRGIQDDLRSLIDEKWSTDVIAAADHAKNMVDAEKLPAVQEILGNFERKTGNMWLQHRRQWDMLYAQRLQLSAEQWSTQVSQLFDQQDREWRNHYAMRNQTYKGIMDALGIDTQLSRDYLTSMTQIAETWNEFHTEAGKLRKKYFDGNKRDNSEEYQKYRIRRDREWNTLQDELDELYEKHSAIENSIQTKMDTYLSDGFETYTGWNPVRVRAWRSYIRALRSDMVKMQREMRKKTRTMDADERDAAYAEFNPAYNKLIADMKRAEILGSAWIRNRPATAETLDSAIKDIKTMIQGEEAKPQQKPQGKKKQPERTPAEKEKEGVVEPEPALRPDPNEELWVLEEPWAQAAPIETEPVTVAPTEEGEPAPVEPPAQPKPQKVSEEWAAIGLAAREAGIVDKMGNIPTRYLLNVFNKHMRESGRPEVTRENLYLQEPKLVMDAINRHKNKHITNPVDVAKKATIRATLDEIANQASSQKREALLKQNGMLTRREIRARLEKMEKVTPDEIDAAMLLMDMYADVYMKRMGYIPTEGTRDAWYATRIADILFDESSDGLQQNNIKSPEFVKWFGNSKVKTVHDEPIRMYHGTANLIFDTFDMSYTDADALFGPGFYFTDNPEVASSYTDTKAPKLQWLKDPIETEKIILDRLHEAYESKRITTTDPNLYQYFAQNHRKYSLATWISMDIDVSDLVIDLNHPGVFPVYLSIQNPFDIDAHMTEQEYADILIEVANYIKGTTDLVYKVNPANALLEEAKKIKENNVAGLRKGKWVYETIYNLVQYKKNIVNEILQRAGYDGIKHTGGMYASLSGTLHQVYIAFKPEQIKSVFNYGGWDVTDPNILHQGPKGTTRLLADARSIINLTKAADITTVVHEVAHIWRRDLSDADVEIIARMGGLDTVQFRQLEQEFHHGEKGHKYKEYRTLQQLDTLTNEQQARLNELTSDADVLDIVQYVKTEETFARGFERYLAEGYAPTPALRSLFKKFSAWLRKIYTNLFRKDGRVQGFEGTDLAVDIQTQVAGRSLRDIYDSMLVEKPSRLKTLDNLIEERAASLKNQSNNWKLSPEELSMLARKQVLDDILSGYENIEDARTFAEGLSDGEWVLSDGTTVDVADVFDAIRMAENIPSINPFEKRKIDQVEGSSTQAHGIKDVTKVYQFKWAVVDMGKITPSHKIRGGKIEINGEYPQIYQPRARESLEYFKQVQTNAALLVPQDLLHDFISIDRGSPIVSQEGNVESGNGRFLMLRYAQQNYPQNWQAYRQLLDEYAKQYGIDPATFAGMEYPMLVRIRTTELNEKELVAFVNDANGPTSQVMNDAEVASADTRHITDQMIIELNIADNENIEGALRAQKNAYFINTFMNKLSENERNSLFVNGELTQSGMDRVVNAIFSKIFQGEAGNRLFEQFKLSIDAKVAAVKSGVYAALPQIAQAEMMMRNGERDASLSLIEDLSEVLAMYTHIPEMGMTPKEWLVQLGLFPSELTPNQMALIHFIINKTTVKNIRTFLREYYNLVRNEPDPRQMTFEYLAPTETRKEFLIQKTIKDIEAELEGKAQPEVQEVQPETVQTEQPTEQIAEQKPAAQYARPDVEAERYLIVEQRGQTGTLREGFTPEQQRRMFSRLNAVKNAAREKYNNNQSKADHIDGYIAKGFVFDRSEKGYYILKNAETGEEWKVRGVTEKAYIDTVFNQGEYARNYPAPTQPAPAVPTSKEPIINVEPVQKIEKLSSDALKEYLRNFYANMYPGDPQKAVDKAEQVWRVIDIRMQNLAKSLGIPADDAYTYFALQQGGDLRTVQDVLSRAAAKANLVAVHNLNPQKLIDAHHLGGFPVPSLAIKKAGDPFDSYGNITLIGNRLMIDPQYSENKIYSGDAYTARRQQFVYKKVPLKKAYAIEKRLSKAYEFAKKFTYSQGASQVWDALVNYPSREKAIETFEYSADLKYAFLSEIGIEINPVWEPVPLYAAQYSTGSRVKAYAHTYPERIQDIANNGTRSEYYQEFSDRIVEDAEEYWKDFQQTLYEKELPPEYDKKRHGDFANEHIRFMRTNDMRDGALKIFEMDQVLRDLKVQQENRQQINRRAVDEQIDNAMKKHKAEYERWYEDILAGLFTPMVKVQGKLEPATLDNIVRAMTRRNQRGQESAGWFGGSPGEVRAQMTKRFKSIADIHKLEDKLMSAAEFEEFKKVGGVNDELMNTYTEGLSRKNQDDNPYTEYGYKREALSEIARGSLTPEHARSVLSSWGYTATNLAIEAALKYLNILKNSPTKYFEAKLERPVYFEEWSGAVIPDDAPKEVIDILKQHGLAYKTYESNNTESRQKAVEEFYDQAGVLFRDQVEGGINSPAFKRWFGNSPVVDADGKPLKLYHGTLSNFTVFEFRNQEAWLGNAFYLTTDTTDASENYASVLGPDWQGHISAMVEHLYNLDDWGDYATVNMDNLTKVLGMDEDAVWELLEDGPRFDKVVMNDDVLGKLALEQLGVQHHGVVMPVYINPQKVLDLTSESNDRLTYEYDEDSGEESGTALDFTRAIRVSADFYEDIRPEELINELFENGLLEDSMSLAQAIKVMKESENIGFAFDMNGEPASAQFVQDVILSMGYDGVKMSAWEQFGERWLDNKVHLDSMGNINENTYHYIVFDPRNIKSAFNQGTWNPENADILLRQQPDTWYYSGLAELIENKMPRNMPVDQFKMLIERQAKAEEVYWTGIEELLEGKDTVSKQEVLDWLGQYGVKVADNWYGSTKLADNVQINYESKYADEYIIKIIKQELARANPTYNSIALVLDNDSGAYNYIETYYPKLLSDYWNNSSEDHWTHVVLKDLLLRKPADTINYLGDAQYPSVALRGSENYKELVLSTPTMDERVKQRIVTLTQQIDKLHNDNNKIVKEDQEYQGLRSEIRELFQKKLDIEQSDEFKSNNTPTSMIAEVANINAKILDLNDRVDELYIKLQKPLVEKITKLDKEREYLWKVKQYRSGHFRGVVNPLAHIRIDDRVDANGNKTLFVMEIQSDLHQQGRRIGYDTYKSKPDEITDTVIQNISSNGGQGTRVAIKVDGELFRSRRDIYAKYPNNPYDLADSYLPPGTFINNFDLLEITSKAQDNGKVLWKIIMPGHVNNPNYEYIYRIGDNSTWHKDYAEGLEIIDKWVKHYDWVRTEEQISYAVYEYGNERGTYKTLDEAIEGAKQDLYGEYLRYDKASNLVPDAPFKKNWHQLAMKRMIRYAAENGYESVSFPTGATAALIEGHEIVEQVSQLRYLEYPPSLEYKTRGSDTWKSKTIRKEEVKDYIGSDAAEQLLAAEPDADGYMNLDTNDIAFGGTKMRWFYDDMLLNDTNKLLKKWGVQVQDGNVKAGKETKAVHTFDITPEMRESVMKGLPLFRKDPNYARVGGATWWNETGQAVVNSFFNSDVADFLHEFIGHAMIPLLDVGDIKTIETWYQQEYGRKPTDNWWMPEFKDVEVFEAVARGFERYMTEGPTGFAGEIVAVFNKIKTWMLDIYRTIMHKDINVNLSDDMKAMFNRWMAMETEVSQSAKDYILDTLRSGKKEYYTPFDLMGSKVPGNMPIYELLNTMVKNGDAELVTEDGEVLGYKAAEKKAEPAQEVVTDKGANDLRAFGYSEQEISDIKQRANQPYEGAEPWTIKLADYVEQDRLNHDPKYYNKKQADFVKSNHKIFVNRAIQEGKQVPSEVLADYPDLQSRQQQRNSYDEYLEQKEMNKDSIVFVKAGDFLETFDTDAEKVSEALTLVLTSIRGRDGERHSMAGFPVALANQQIALLNQAGHRKTFAYEPTGPDAKPIRQMGFFEKGEDTPLFSGVAQTAREEVFKPKTEGDQDSLFNMREQLPTIEGKQAADTEMPGMFAEQPKPAATTALPEGYEVKPGKYAAENKYAVFKGDVMVGEYGDTPERAVQRFYDQSEHSYKVAQDTLKKHELVLKAIDEGADKLSLAELKVIFETKYADTTLEHIADWLRVEMITTVSTRGALKQAKDHVKGILKGKAHIDSGGYEVYALEDVMEAVASYPGLRESVLIWIETKKEQIAEHGKVISYKQNQPKQEVQPEPTAEENAKNNFMWSIVEGEYVDLDDFIKYDVKRMRNFDTDKISDHGKLVGGTGEQNANENKIQFRVRYKGMVLNGNNIAGSLFRKGKIIAHAVVDHPFVQFDVMGHSGILLGIDPDSPNYWVYLDEGNIKRFNPDNLKPAEQQTEASVSKGYEYYPETLPADELTFEKLEQLYGNKSGGWVIYRVENGGEVRAARKTVTNHGVVKTNYLHVVLVYPSGKYRRYRQQTDGTYKQTDYGKIKNYKPGADNIGGDTGNVLEQAAQRRLLTGRQLGFFDSGEDTPLFSGVAQEAKEEVFAPEPEDVNAQLSLFDIPELQPQMGRRTPPPINRVIGYLSSDESRPISLIEDASMLAKDFRTIAVSINGQEILATEGQNYHNEIIRKYDKKLNEDYFVRFKANSGFLMTADYYAGVINLITESDRVKALNNIYAALDKMVARGLDPSTPVDIYRHGLSVIHTTAGDVTGNVLEQPMNPVGDVQPGTVPQPQFEGELLQEVNEDYVNPMVNRMKEAYKANMGRQFKMSDMPANIQKEMHTYLNQVNNDLSSTKLAAVRYGEQMRDAALLNYSRRYGFDQYLNLVFPYQFWYTRSLMNWATRMVDKPVWFSMYARLRRIQEEQERKGMPSRLRGKIRLAMPWLPEWMGGGVWQDPMKQLLPFSQFFQPIEQAAVNNNQLHRRTEQILYDMVEQDQISTAELNTALNDQEGNVWDRAFKQAEMELDINSNPATLVSTLMQPALWWTIPSKLMQGKGEEISVLPITRTGQSLKTATEGTMLEGIGKFAGGVLAGPEEYIREKSGLSKYGEWGDYYVDRQIANLVADGEVSVEEGLRAMIERTGEAYDLAMQRVNQEMMLRTPGTLPILAIKEGASPVEVAAAIISSLFPSGLFPTGELEMRNLKAEYDAAWKRFHAGDEEAINTFWDEHPEYEARLALYDEPEERLRQFLVNEIWDKYTQLESANKTAAVDQLGEEFEQSFLNEETQSYDSTDIKTLAVWAQLLGSSLPSVEEVSNLPESQPLELYEPELLTAVDEYYAERDKLFPLATGWQSIYFSLSPTERKAFLKQYPKLKDYWEWNDEYKQEHPDIADYLTERYGSQESYLEDVNDLTAPLTRALLQYYMVGKPLTSGARAELQRIWLMNGSKGGSLDDYTQQLVLTIFGG